jgi:hypothetical protein
VLEPNTKFYRNSLTYFRDKTYGRTAWLRDTSSQLCVHFM